MHKIEKLKYSNEYDKDIKINVYNDINSNELTGFLELSIINSPIGNCQISSVRNMKHILSYWKRDKDFVFKIIDYLFENTSKPILLFDINESYEYHLDEIILDKYRLISKQKYKSTNSSNMIIYLVTKIK